jgi:hypothetical protein
MGLFGGLQDLLGSKNTYHVDPLNLNQFDYNEAMKKAQEAALGSINQGNAAGQNQATLNQQLMDQANGVGPSLAQLQLQQASDDNIKNQAGLIASQRGMNPANAARAIALSGANQGQQLANQSAQLRLQEQLQKQQLLAQGLASQRGQDIGQQGANASLFGLTGQLNQGQNAQNMQNYYAAHGINAGVEAQNVAGANQLGGQLIGAGSAILAGPVGAKYAGGEVDTSLNLVSPGEKIIEPDGDVKSVGGTPRVPGDHPANDTVPVFLEDGTVVVPRSKAKNKKEMFDFLQSVKGKQKPSDELKDLLVKREQINARLKDISGLKNNYFDGGVVEDVQQPVMQQPVDINLTNPKVQGQETLLNNQTAVTPDVPETPTPTAPNPFAGIDMSGGYNLAKQAESNLSAGLDSTMAKADDIAEQARLKAEQRNQELDAMANEKINSNNYWGSMSTPDKIRSGIAILLGGIGAGLAGGKNLALETINDAITKDIEAQKANKNSLYNALIAKGHNDEYATATTLKSINNQTENLLKKYQASATTAQAKQALDQFNAQLKFKQAEYDQANISQATQTAIIDKALSGKELSPQEMVGLPDKIKQKYIGGQGGGYAPYGSEKMFTDASNSLAQRNGIDESIKEIKSLVQEGSRAGISTEEKAKASARAAALVGQLRLLIAGPGTLSDSDKEQIYKVIPENPLALFSLTGNTMAKLDTALDLVNTSAQKSLAQVGLNRNFSRSQQQNSFLNNTGAKEVAR